MNTDGQQTNESTESTEKKNQNKHDHMAFVAMGTVMWNGTHTNQIHIHIKQSIQPFPKAME